jgi:hypothetical protein
MVPVLAGVLALTACSAAPVTSAPPPTASTSATPVTTATASAAPTASAIPSTPTQPRTGAAAADAFKTWVEQYNAEQWDKHYRTLVSAQQKLISGKKYAACRDKSVNPTFKWVKTVKTKANVMSSIPGTSKKAPATLVTVRLRVSGFTLPITAHMFYEDGMWRWSMTKENIKGCKK